MYDETRSRLTRHDREFIAHTLGKTSDERKAIQKLTDDPSAVTALLHDKRLLERSMSVPPHLLSISPQLFFYVFIYRALDHRRIADDDVVDYITGICVEFRFTDALWQSTSATGEKMIYIVDMLNLMNDLDRHQQYFLRRHIGNVSLFLTGFFPDYIFKRSQHKAAPPIEYYESVGRTQYETAACESLTFDAKAAPVLTKLADRFVAIRSALNVFTDAYLNLANKHRSLERIQRQVATLDDESLKQSLDL